MPNNQSNQIKKMCKNSVSIYFCSLLLFSITLLNAKKICDPKDCKFVKYTPDHPFVFAQQLFWDNRTQSVIVSDASADQGKPSITHFDWASKTFHQAVITNHAKNTVASFAVPAASCPKRFVVGVDPDICLVSWDGNSQSATTIRTIATRSAQDGSAIDRGTTRSDGTLYCSIIPQYWCQSNSTRPEQAVCVLDRSSSTPVLRDAVTPGTYSNGIVFYQNSAYLGDDCRGCVRKYMINSDSTWTFNRNFYCLPPNMVTTNYISCMTVDSCGNIYIGDHGSNKVYAVDKNGNCFKVFEVDGNYVTAVGLVGPNLDYLLVTTGRSYHDIFGGNRATATGENDGSMYLFSLPSCGYYCRGNPPIPVAGF